MNIPDNYYSGKKVLIMGLGLNSGGLYSALYLADKGAEITVTDLRDEKALAPSIDKLDAGLAQNGKKARYVLGLHELSDFEKADVVVKNPGVRPDSQYLRAARQIETDISLFLAASPARLSAVTGSKGKSSIASALHHVLKNWTDSSENPDAGKHKAYLGGNIALSPLSFLDELKTGDDVVLELSSWQIGDLKDRLKPDNSFLLKPRVAVLGAIMPDHLDRYGTMDAYVADKRILYKGQEKDDATISGDDSWGESFRKESRGRPLVYGNSLLQGLSGGWVDEASGCGMVKLWERCRDYRHTDEIVEAVPANLLVPGKHQKKNMLAAALALLDLGLPIDFVRESIGKFPGIEHRLEFFHEWKGIKFYNDSAATIPEAAAAAVKTFDRPPVLVCGGTDKGLDYAPLIEAASYTASIILLAGTGSSKLSPMLEAKGIAFSGPYDSLEKAVEKTLQTAKSGDTIILSPGCTSFGMFLNEFDRGKKWKEAIRKYT